MVNAPADENVGFALDKWTVLSFLIAFTGEFVTGVKAEEGISFEEMKEASKEIFLEERQYDQDKIGYWCAMPVGKDETGWHAFKIYVDGIQEHVLEKFVAMLEVAGLYVMVADDSNEIFVAEELEQLELGDIPEGFELVDGCDGKIQICRDAIVG